MGKRRSPSITKENNYNIKLPSVSTNHFISTDAVYQDKPVIVEPKLKLMENKELK